MKGIKTRKVIRDLVDYDYYDKLSPQDQEFLKKATDEYYCNGVAKENSLHRQHFNEEAFQKQKKLIFRKTNGENRDLLGARSLFREEFEEELIPISDDNSYESMLNHVAPADIMEQLMNETEDEITTSPHDVSDILKEHTYKTILLFILARRQTARPKANKKPAKKTKPIKTKKKPANKAKKKKKSNGKIQK